MKLSEVKIFTWFYKKPTKKKKFIDAEGKNLFKWNKTHRKKSYMQEY